ncbi:hypothetical protein QFC21_005812 [Naganishia friedmannii]|uniref:Uncharacterized protein n=1 Tax=Naganishia friedmannii TaxID=89922 RepID=A0ACC2V6N2_9TREE|nr:hypothetical protein QFC21_005812 [Naganishia friedmannii]
MVLHKTVTKKMVMKTKMYWEDENEDLGENMGMDIEDIDEPVVQPKYVGPAKYECQEPYETLSKACPDKPSQQKPFRQTTYLERSLVRRPNSTFATWTVGAMVVERLPALTTKIPVVLLVNSFGIIPMANPGNNSPTSPLSIAFKPSSKIEKPVNVFGTLKYAQSVRWAGKRVEGGGKYFDDDTQIALGLATDGMPCWKRSRLDCWPFIVTNYSPPPEIRTKREYQICCGLIPGQYKLDQTPKATADYAFVSTGTREEITGRKVVLDSFLWPLLEDLEILAGVGFPAQRWIGDKQQAFNLRAHLIVVSGDMPAISKGIGSKLASRWCTMPAVRAGVPKSEYGKYYMTTKSPASTTRMNYAELPVRTKAGILKDIDEIRGCIAKTSMEAMQTEKGINDQSVFALIGSIDFPWSFSADIMHILFENIMKELLGLWEGKYKASMVTGAVNGRLSAAAGENYVISKVDWDAMDGEVASSNATVPAQMARRLGSLSKRGYWTTETYSYFLLHLGPTVLKE